MEVQGVLIKGSSGDIFLRPAIDFGDQLRRGFLIRNPESVQKFYVDGSNQRFLIKCVLTELESVNPFTQSAIVEQVTIVKDRAEDFKERLKTEANPDLICAMQKTLDQWEQGFDPSDPPPTFL